MEQPVININLGGLSKPATMLIKKISNAMEGLARPAQVIRVAKADAAVEIIRVETEIKITQLHRRAAYRFFVEEAKKQKNIEEITRKAIPQLNDSSRPQEIEDDWITNFFDKCRIISDEEMQTLWSKVLAGEANAPGTFSRRTVNFLGSLDKADARLFTALCGFIWIINDDMIPLIYDIEYDIEASIYNKADVKYVTLTHLDDIGLISFVSLGGRRIVNLAKRPSFLYYGQSIIVELKKEENNELEIGHALLTKTGEQLAQICGSKPVDGFMDYILDYWLKKGLVLASPFTPN